MGEDKLLEMSGSIEQVIYKNKENGYAVIEINNGEELVTCVGIIPWVNVGEDVHVVGGWVNNPSYGTQFKVEAVEHSTPTTAAAILKYLSSGAIKGIGPVTAEKIVNLFGENTLQIIENEPEGPMMARNSPSRISRLIL